MIKSIIEDNIEIEYVYSENYFLIDYIIRGNEAIQITYDDFKERAIKFTYGDNRSNNTTSLQNQSSNDIIYDRYGNIRAYEYSKTINDITENISYGFTYNNDLELDEVYSNNKLITKDSITLEDCKKAVTRMKYQTLDNPKTTVNRYD